MASDSALIHVREGEFTNLDMAYPPKGKNEME